MEVREEIVRACLAEMRATLERDQPQPDKDARILLYSGILTTFKAEQILPTLPH